MHRRSVHRDFDREVPSAIPLGKHLNTRTCGCYKNNQTCTGPNQFPRCPSVSKPQRHGLIIAHTLPAKQAVPCTASLLKTGVYTHNPHRCRNFDRSRDRGFGHNTPLERLVVRSSSASLLPKHRGRTRSNSVVATEMPCSAETTLSVIRFGRSSVRVATSRYGNDR